MKIHIKLLVSVFFFLFAKALFAQASTQANTPSDSSVNSLLQLAQQKQLASSRQWLSLLHYNQGGTLNSRKSSYADDRNFFISETGEYDAEKELEANIRAFFSGSFSDGLAEDMEKRCQFPARFHWLSEQFEFPDYQQGLAHCELFLKVQKQVAAKKLVLVFPSAYMNSASSIFGHTLLRIDTSENDESVILNWAINYGAKLTEGDNSLEYAYKGITGLYKGQYFVVPYSQKIKEYGQMENRDIWEYPLSLNEKEINFLLEHLWELKDINFDYYFFDENCSYRLLELLEVARPELQLTADLRLTEIPINTVKILKENKLLEDEVFRPSKESLLKAQLLQLSKEEKKLSTTLANPEKEIKQTLQTETYIKTQADKKIAVFDTAYDLVRFRQTQKQRDKKLAKRSLELLSNINNITLDNPDAKQSELEINAESILKTHDSQRLLLGAGRIKDSSNYGSLQYRMAYHDLIDNSEGFISGAHIEGPALTAKYFENEVYIDSWQVVDIISISPITRLRKDLSWNLSIQGQKTEEAKQNISAFVQAGGGFSFQYQQLIHYQMFSPRIENNRQYEQDVQVGLVYSAGLLFDKGKHASLMEFNYIKLEEEEALKKLELAQQIEISRNHALRFKLISIRQDDVSVEIEQDSAELSYLLYF